MQEYVYHDREIREVFEQLGADSDCRAVVLAASGRIFTAGIDLSELAEIGGVVMGDDDVARKARNLTPMITAYQASFTALEKVLTLLFFFLLDLLCSSCK